MDDTGTGNTLNVRIRACCRWSRTRCATGSTEMHVDGFRFDLATILAREFHGFDRLAASSTSSTRTRCSAQVKLIAEPWDVGPGGYQVGGFPPGWAEWNDKYRDTVRDFWRGERGEALGELAARLTGSGDLYNRPAAGPGPAINFVTAHDGFTLHDLVSYNDKHNEANGEDNNDGQSHNRSWNCGVEGPTDDEAEINAAARPAEAQPPRDAAASQGTPMILAGDEFGRTQGATTTSTARTARSAGWTGPGSARMAGLSPPSRAS
jgi:isoamylase